MFASIGHALLAMTIVTAAGTLLTVVFGHNSKLVPYLRYLFALVLVLLMMEPIRVILSAVQMFSSQISAPDANAQISARADALASLYESRTVTCAKEAAEQAIVLLITQKTGIPQQDITLQLDIDDTDTTNIIITHVTVILTDTKYRVMQDKITAMLRDMLECGYTIRFLRENNGEEVTLLS